MPYTKMTGLELPHDDAIVWRYMDMWKYESMIKNQSIYFVRTDRFDDSWDSVLPPSWLRKMNRDSGIERAHGGTYTETEWYQEREIPSNLISSWNVCEEDSRRMWETYTARDEAVAVRTSIGRLKACFLDSNCDVRIGLVRYGDHYCIEDPQFAVAYWPEVEACPQQLNPWYVPRFLKRVEFNFESEVRATIHVSPPVDQGHHLKIGINGLHTLINSVRVKPGAHDAFLRRIETLHSTHDLSGIAVEHSRLLPARI